jgi:hypothetical protein
VPIQKTAAYFYPPQDDCPSIVLFYDPESQDFSKPLYLLFHEAGHARQWQHHATLGQGELFHRRMNLDKGEEKVAFEKEAWDFGRKHFITFIEKKNRN